MKFDLAKRGKRLRLQQVFSTGRTAARFDGGAMKNPILVLTLYSIHRQLGTPWREAIALAWRQA